MSDIPECPCFQDGGRQADEKELVCQGFGAASGEMLRVNAQMYKICHVALPYMAGAGLCGFVSTTAFLSLKDGEEKVTYEALEQALDAVVAAARARLKHAYLQHLEVGGTA